MTAVINTKPGITEKLEVLLKFIYTLLLFIMLFFNIFIFPQNKINEENYITTNKSEGVFTLAESKLSAPIFISNNDYPGVEKVAKLLQNDIKSVTGGEPVLSVISSGKDFRSEQKDIILIGTLGKNPLIDQLVDSKKINVEDITGKWETFIIKVVENPFPEINRVLVIAGSDKRGTIFGMFDLSEKIGVSPWYWWADVPVKKKESVYLLPGKFTMGEPKVKYRGIFINDEAPALSGWSQEKFGTVQFNHKLYEHVFELILRLKGNFLWPAMWGRAFYDDDSLNPKLADEYGIVISTSHHEPMMRAHVEWERYGTGPWNYEKNKEALKDFWRKGIERMSGNESVITLAMRGDGDEAMSEDANVELLERIVHDQREIIEDVTGKPAESIPQVWALYKEVQEYYDKGMRVPDDVTILLCDDNWGNIRKLPKLNAEPRKGGYGIYYHYDYVGGPRNYKWLNTNQIERVWEQMHLAYEYGADRIWVVNVGDIKPVEFPIDFFFDYAWNPENFPAESLPEYYNDWAEKQFGTEFSKEIAEIISKYTKFNSRRKPELLSPGSYSLINYREAEIVVAEYNQLLEEANKIYNSIPDEYKDAYYQLVLHPVAACANLNELYVTAAKNHLYAKQERAETNLLAKKVEEIFEKDKEITDYYNNIMADGKWSHMMDQTHIGYTSWQQPDKNIMPEVKKIENITEAEMGVAVEGSEDFFPQNIELSLPVFDVFNKQSYFIEIFNKGKSSFYYSIETGEPWVQVKKSTGKITNENRVWVNIDWENAPAGRDSVPIKISGAEGSYALINAIINNNSSIPEGDAANSFIESNGYVSIEAVHYSNAVETSEVQWKVIENLGRTHSAVTPFPITSQSQVPGKNSPHLEYQVFLFSEGEVKVDAYFSPTLNFHNRPEGIRYAVSFDDEEPQIINMTDNPNPSDLHRDPVWSQWVANNINIKTSKHNIENPGEHILKIWFVDPGIVLQKLVIDTGGEKPSYLGPPESYRNKIETVKAD